jgi:hypothetical protein
MPFRDEGALLAITLRALDDMSSLGLIVEDGGVVAFADLQPEIGVDADLGVAGSALAEDLLHADGVVEQLDRLRPFEMSQWITEAGVELHVQCDA